MPMGVPLALEVFRYEADQFFDLFMTYDEQFNTQVITNESEGGHVCVHAEF